MDQEIRATIQAAARRLMALGIRRRVVADRLTAFFGLDEDTVEDLVEDTPEVSKRAAAWTADDVQEVQEVVAEMFGVVPAMAAYQAAKLIPHFAEGFDIDTVPLLEPGVYRVRIQDMVAYAREVAGLEGTLKEAVYRDLVAHPKHYRVAQGHSPEGDEPAFLIREGSEILPLEVGSTGPDFAEVAPHLVDFVLHRGEGTIRLYRSKQDPDAGILILWSSEL